MQKSEKHYATLQLAAEWPHHEQKLKFDQDQHQYFLRKMPKSEENFETLELATEWHSMNKNQSLIKIRPVVPEKNTKKCRKFGNMAAKA